MESLRKNLLTLQSEGHFADVIVEVEGQNFSLHKTVLAHRSPQLLERIANRGTNDGDSTLFKSKNVMKSLIYFIYSDEMEPTLHEDDPKPFNIIIPLMKLCKELNHPRLYSILFNRVNTSLKPTNALEISQMATDHKVEDVVKISLEAIELWENSKKIPAAVPSVSGIDNISGLIRQTEMIGKTVLERLENNNNNKINMLEDMLPIYQNAAMDKYIGMNSISSADYISRKKRIVEPMEVPKETLADDMKKMMDETSSADFTIEHDSVQYKVNRCILVARGSYFKAMITSSFLEQSKNSVTIKEDDPTPADIFKFLLTHMYTGSLKFDESEALLVLSKLSYFGISSPELSKHCASIVAQNIGPEDSLKIYEDALELVNDDLRKVAFRVIMKNYKQVKSKFFGLKPHVITAVLLDINSFLMITLLKEIPTSDVERLDSLIDEYFDETKSSPLKKVEKRCLIVGLDSAGKTTLLYKLRLGEVVPPLPTTGFNVETVEYKNISFIMWDVGGNEKLRSNWRHYYLNTSCVIFVVDSNDRDRMDEAAEELSRVMREDELKDACLLVLANKQDLPTALPVSEICDRLGLYILQNRQWFIQGTCSMTGDGLYEGLDWIFHAI